MNNKNTDVIIYTQNPLSEEQFSEVANQIKSMKGVIKFDRNQNRPALIMVMYNAGKIHAITILNKLTRLGFNASLVGI